VWSSFSFTRFIGGCCLCSYKCCYLCQRYLCFAFLSVHRIAHHLLVCGWLFHDIFWDCDKNQPAGLLGDLVSDPESHFCFVLFVICEIEFFLCYSLNVRTVMLTVLVMSLISSLTFVKIKHKSLAGVLASLFSDAWCCTFFILCTLIFRMFPNLSEYCCFLFME